MPTPLLPLRPPGSFASADDISKELLQHYEGGREGRVGGSIWIKLDLSVALKVRRLFSSRWERARTRVCDGERRDSLDSPQTFV